MVQYLQSTLEHRPSCDIFCEIKNEFKKNAIVTSVIVDGKH